MKKWEEGALSNGITLERLYYRFFPVLQIEKEYYIKGCLIMKVYTTLFKKEYYKDCNVVCVFLLCKLFIQFSLLIIIFTLWYAKIV